jgi:negative regulator of flagellin synthesis FlgM
MSNIDTRSPFFPNRPAQKKETATGLDNVNRATVQRNTPQRFQEIANKTSQDAKVSIPEEIRDFSKIKKAVDAAPEIDNSEKIARLKAQIQAGTYQVDYDAVADKILDSEF